jgi:hypothetical protein
MSFSPNGMKLKKPLILLVRTAGLEPAWEKPPEGF